MDRRNAFDLAYLVCACLFIFGLKQLSSPRTAVRGNQVAAGAMASRDRRHAVGLGLVTTWPGSSPAW